MVNEKILIDVSEWESFYNERTKGLDEYDHFENGYENAFDSVDYWIKAQPKVDAVEVVHGRWFMRGGIFRCSECDSKALLKLDSNVGGCREYTHFRSNYCPNCGADMRGCRS